MLIWGQRPSTQLVSAAQHLSDATLTLKKTLEIEWGCPSRPEEATGDPVGSLSSTGKPCKKAL
jgi:hypothetical protein